MLITQEDFAWSCASIVCKPSFRRGPIPTPPGAAAVQELLGGKFGEMSTFMNYTYQSFKLRGETGEELTVAEEPQPEGALPHDLPPQPAPSRPDPRSRRSERSPKLREAAGLPKKPTGHVT